MTSPPTPAPAIPIPQPRIACGRMPDGSAVLYHPGPGKAYAVNGTAADVWEMCDGQRAPAAIVASMSARFAAEPAVIEAGVVAVLAHFRALGLLEEP